MDYLVFLDAQAGELEKILSGVKNMLVKEIDPDEPAGATPRPGDSLYFLRDNAELAVRVRATVLRVLPWVGSCGADISRILKELQPRLQLTEQQYNHWSAKEQALFIELEAAQKIEELHIASETITRRKTWIDFEEVRQLEQKGRDYASGNTG